MERSLGVPPGQLASHIPLPAQPAKSARTTNRLASSHTCKCSTDQSCMSCNLFRSIMSPAQQHATVQGLVACLRQGMCPGEMFARKQCEHIFGDAHQQMHRALPRSSTEGMKVARLAGLLTQPPIQHSHICCRLIWSAEIATTSLITLPSRHADVDC